MSISRKNKHWNDEEIQYLYENIGKKSITTIAKNLNRTIYGIKTKSRKLNLEPGEQSGLYTIYYIAKCFKTCESNMYKKLKSITITKNLHIKIIKKYIRGKEFWKLVEKNKDKFNFKSYKKGSILPEPQWLLNKEYKHNYRIFFDDWTEHEIKMLKFYRNKGLKIKEISDKLNRTTSSIKSKLKKLRIYKEIHLEWKEEEIKILNDMFKNGYSYKEIAYKVGRNENNVAKYFNRRGIHRINTNKITEEETCKIKKLIENGYSYREISEKLNIHTSKIIRKCREINYRSKAQKEWSEKEIKKLIKLREKGMKYKDMEKYFNDRSISALQQKINKINNKNV